MSAMKINQKRWISETGEDNVYRMLLPIVLELLLTYAIGNLNQMILNRFSREAVAATTAAGSFLSLMVTMYSIFYAGQGILLAACWGRKEFEEGGRIWTVSLGDSVLLGVLLGAVGVFGSGFVLTCMQVPAELSAMAREYLMVALGLSVFQGLALTFASAFRAIGEMKTVMLGNVLINGSCVFMNGLILVFVPAQKQSICQYAFAGIFAQIFGVCFYLKRMLGNEHIRLIPVRENGAKLFRSTTGKIVGFGLFGGMEGVIYLVSQTIVMSMIGKLGTQALMVKGYSGNLFNYLTLPSAAVPLAAATVIGMSIGMRDEERAQECFRKCLRLSVCATLFLCALALIWGRPFLGMYVDDPQMMDACIRLLLLDIAVELCRCVAALMVSSLKAIGEVRMPFLMVIAGSALNVGISWLLGIHLGGGLPGIWVGYGADLAFRGFLGLLVWKKHRREHTYPVWKSV